MFSKQEYAELCSAIKTKYGNKIPKSGYMLYNDACYLYNYNNKRELIVCVNKLKIIGNEDRVNQLLRWYDGNK